MATPKIIPINWADIPPGTDPNMVTPVWIAYVTGGVGWQITTCDDGCIYTPQTYEQEFNFLPPCPSNATRKARKEWYAHKRVARPFKGFKPSHPPKTQKLTKRKK